MRRVKPVLVLNPVEVSTHGESACESVWEMTSLWSESVTELWLTQFDQGDLSLKKAEALVIHEYEAKIAVLSHARKPSSVSP